MSEQSIPSPMKRIQSQQSSQKEDERINPYANFTSDPQEEEREFKILSHMDQLPKKINYAEQHKFIAYLNHLSYFYARISRALLYNYSNLKLEDFIISTFSYSDFRKSTKKILVNTLNLILKRLQYFSQESDTLPNIDDSIFDRITDINIVINKYLGDTNLDYNETDLQNQIEFMKSQNYTEKSQKSKLQLDIQNIENILDAFILKQSTNLSYKIVEEAQKAEISFIEPFIGFAGKKSNLVISYDKIQKIINDDSLKSNDFRGLFAYGNSPVLYVAWHGSCQEYDWHANLESGLISPHDSLLPELPKHWRIMEGYAELINLCWTAKQNTQINQQKSVEEKQLERVPNYFESFQQKLKGKKTAFFTGHSQGAGMAQLACIYTEQLLNSQGYEFRGLFLSLPRTLDTQTAIEVDRIFGINQNKGDNKLIRQNVLGDPVPLMFQNCKEVFRRIRSVCSLGQILFQDQFLGILKRILTDPKFLKSLKKAQLENANIFQKIDVSIQTEYIQNFILKPLYSDKYNGNFSKFLIDYSSDNIDIVHKQLWIIVAKVYKDQILQYIPQGVKEKLEIKEDLITGDDLRGLINSIARLVIVGEDNMNNIEHLIFESEYQYEYQNIIFKQKTNQDKPKDQKGIKGLWEYFKFSTKDDKKAKNTEGQEEEHEIFAQETPSMFLSKRFLKAMINDFMEKKFYTQKLSLLGEIFEGILYFSASFGDTGMLLLDQLDFHKSCKRVEDLRLLENFFGSQTKNINVQGIDTKLAIHKSKEQILSYFAPYHYGEQDLEGSFNPELVVDSQLSRMHGFANFFLDLSENDKVQELYRLGLLKKHKQQIKNMTDNTDDILIMKHRIEAKIYFSPYLLQDLNINSHILTKQDIQKIVNKFKLIRYSEGSQEMSYEKENQELKQLVSYSYFLSSLFKSIQVLYSEKPMVLERQFYHIYSNFINNVAAKKNENDLNVFTKLHQQFLKDSLNYIRNNQFAEI